MVTVEQLGTVIHRGNKYKMENQHAIIPFEGKELTDEWQKRGVTESSEYAILTSEIAKAKTINHNKKRYLSCTEKTF